MGSEAMKSLMVWKSDEVDVAELDRMTFAIFHLNDGVLTTHCGGSSGVGVDSSELTIVVVSNTGDNVETVVGFFIIKEQHAEGDAFGINFRS